MPNIPDIDTLIDKLVNRIGCILPMAILPKTLARFPKLFRIFVNYILPRKTRHWPEL